MNVYSNTCYRCGKERIFVRSWKERIGNSVVVTKEMACPDLECQKKVDEENHKRTNKFMEAKAKRINRIKDKRKKLN
ncbi:MAG: hypothetical protein ACOYUB_04380 [Patescibacteria group bacterium]